MMRGDRVEEGGITRTEHVRPICPGHEADKERVLRPEQVPAVCVRVDGDVDMDVRVRPVEIRDDLLDLRPRFEPENQIHFHRPPILVRHPVVPQDPFFSV